MRILAICHYFPPEIGAPQARISEMAKAWSTAGDEVTVLTGMPNHPTGIVHERYRGRWRVVERIDGYRVVRTWLYATPNEGFVKKTLGHLSFMVTSVLLGFRQAGKADVVMVSSPTFFSIFSAMVIAKLRRAPLVVEVRDLWPGIFVELGVLTNRRLIWLLERLELFAYRIAAHVVVVTEGFRDDLIRRGVPAQKVTTITNGVDLDRFTPKPAHEEDRAWLGAGADDLLVLYIGAHGVSHALSSVVRGAARLADSPVRFAFVGEGADKANVVELAGQLGVGNLVFRDGVPRDRVADLVAAADVCLVPLRDIPLFSTFIPSKMFEFMAAGRPIVGSVRGEPATILERAGSVVIEPESPQALAETLGELAADRARLGRIAAAQREFVERNYDRTALAGEYQVLLHRVAA